jgi:hypothetical protein
MRRVRHIEAENIHARIHELADHRGGIRRGAKGGNDFRPAQSPFKHGGKIYFSSGGGKILIRARKH